jgi:hypothetical protein
MLLGRGERGRGSAVWFVPAGQGDAGDDVVDLVVPLGFGSRGGHGDAGHGGTRRVVDGQAPGEVVGWGGVVVGGEEEAFDGAAVVVEELEHGGKVGAVGGL